MHTKTFFINLVVIAAIFLSLGGVVQSAAGADANSGIHFDPVQLEEESLIFLPIIMKPWEGMV